MPCHTIGRGAGKCVGNLEFEKREVKLDSFRAISPDPWQSFRAGSTVSVRRLACEDGAATVCSSTTPGSALTTRPTSDCLSNI
jgi:hypothetical protein